MHTQFTQLMSLALDHEADADQMAILQAHLAECAACAATWAHWQAMEADLRAATTLFAPAPGLTGRVMARLAVRQRRQRYRWLRAGVVLVWLGTVAVFMLALMLIAWWSLAHPLQAGILISAGTRLLSSTLWPIRGVQTLLAGAGISWPWLMASYVGMTAGLFLIWVWLLARPQVGHGATDENG
ncbi:MAG: anti-sigma factor [Anaerolineae bacterium]|nr:anti-sigma factor [Anaerolineae bacterium]